MKKKYQNGFFIFGIVVLIIMVTQLDFQQVWEGLQRAGYWFFAVIILWAFLYLFNTAVWYIIIRSGEEKAPAPQAAESTGNSSITPSPVKFFWLYKVTVSGFALNYATPGGLMGGEPYRIMELTPKIGAARASSSVILYAMTHIFSHFWFWLVSVLLYALTRPINLPVGIMLCAVLVFCALGIWFFIVGYRKGLAFRMMNVLSHIPGARNWAKDFISEHREQLDTIDRQIAALHKQNPRTFFMAVLLELACRILSSAEIMFCLLVLMPSVNFIDCILILAFTSLFANLLFFIPLQLGGREGGFLMSTAGLQMTASAGIFVGLIVRLRELIWVAIGLVFIKINKKSARIAEN